MNCTDTQQYFHEYIDSLLSTDKTQSVRAHLDECSVCSEKIKKEQELRDILRKLPVEPAQEGFFSRVVERAVSQGQQQKQQFEQDKRHKRQGFLQGFSVALAASVCFWIVLTLLPQGILSGTGSSGTTADQSGLRIALHDTHDLNLAFYSHKKIANATVSLFLPQNVALVGYPGEKQLTWQVNLVKGDNRLSLPIKGVSLASGELIATIAHGQRSKLLKVNIRITEPGIQKSALQSGAVAI